MLTNTMKPRFVWSIFLLCGLLTVALISKEGDHPSPIHGESDYTITLNAANAPTDSNTYTDTLQTVRYTEFAYGDVRFSDGHHVEMSSNAWIRNNYQITSITGITVVFSGEGLLDISVSYDTDSYFEYPLTSGVRKDFANLPYYFQLMSCNAPIFIESIVLTYSCVAHETTLDKYIVSWYDEDGMTLLERDVDVEPGSMPSYDGPTPTKPYDEMSGEFYAFDGWDMALGPVTRNTEYYAQYTPYFATYSLINGGTEYELREITVNTLKTISIPSSYNGLPVTSIGMDVFSGFASLAVVDLPSTLTNIGDYAFSGCESLTSIHLPASLASLGMLPFVSCLSLTSISVDEANTNYSSIDGVLFNEAQDTLICFPNGKGTSYTIPSSVTTLGHGAFFKSIFLESVTIPSSVTTLGGSVFGFCESLNNVFLPNTITSMGSSVFVFCTGLTSVSLPSGLTVLPASTFQGCGSLPGVILPSGLTSIELDAFSGCSFLSSISIPNGVTHIGSRAFQDCISLGNVTLPEGLLTIGGNAFTNCDTMTAVAIPASVTSIGDYAFAECSSLATISVAAANTVYAFTPDGVLYSEDMTTLICYPSGKTEATYVIPSSVATIVSNAFRNNPYITSVIIPISVSTIDYIGFNLCPNVTLNCEATVIPPGWSASWATGYSALVWGYGS